MIDFISYTYRKKFLNLLFFVFFNTTVISHFLFFLLSSFLTFSVFVSFFLWWQITSDSCFHSSFSNKTSVVAIVLTCINVVTARLCNAWIHVKLHRVYISAKAISGLSFDALSFVCL